MTNDQVIAGLREAADWLESHPEFEVYTGAGAQASLQLENMHGKDALAALARAFGHAEKRALGEDHFQVTRAFGLLHIYGAANRALVCRKVVKGVEQVPESVIQERVVPAHEREIVEWECPPSLLAGASS